MGPGAGDEGGRIVTQGPPAQVMRASASRTAPYLARFVEGEDDTSQRGAAQ
ncbi:MAG: hypothetical protein ACOY0T_28235 [Myxococcota bacterium]